MAVSSLSLSFTSQTLANHHQLCGHRGSRSTTECAAVSSHAITATCLKNTSHTISDEDDKSTKARDLRDCKRRAIVLGIGALTLSPLAPASSLLAEGKPDNYEAFVDKIDGYSYYYPSDWREFDFIGHDSAFKDRYLQLQNVRLSFIPTSKTDIRDLGPMDEVVDNLVNNVYSAPTQVANVLDIQERNIDGKNYWTFEYILTSPNFSRAAFATIAIGNGRYYTLIVGANERRWRRVRNKLRVVADSFKVLDI